MGQVKFIHIQSIVRVFVGCTFVLSALLKFLSMDNFEIYFYSIGLFSLDLSFIFARFLISLELIIGLLLVSHLYKRKVWRLSMAVLVLFSVFLVYLLVRDDKGNCHCFGELIKMSPLESLGKNIILILLLLLIKNQIGIVIKFQKLLVILVLFVSISFPLVASPPDFLVANRYAGITGMIDQSDNEYFKRFIDQNNYGKGKRVICFFSMTCRFCKLASQKISVMAAKAGEDIYVAYVFFGREEIIKKFWIENSAHHYPSHIIPVRDFFKISNGRLPMIVFLEDGEVRGVYGYRNLTEQDFNRFFDR